MSEKVLDPGEIAAKLMLVRPDRDQRASQVCVEFLLTLVANSYTAPSHESELKSPKMRRFALRSLVFGRNFLEGYDELIPGTAMSAEEYGRRLACGEEVLGSSHLDRAQVALRGLVDPSTETGAEPGQYLLMPFHESLLWYDARSAHRRFTVRKVRMRGTGVTLARALLDPPTRWLVPRGGVRHLWGEGVQAWGVHPHLDLGGPQHEPALGHPRHGTLCED